MIEDTAAAQFGAPGYISQSQEPVAQVAFDPLGYNFPNPLSDFAGAIDRATNPVVDAVTNPTKFATDQVTSPLAAKAPEWGRNVGLFIIAIVLMGVGLFVLLEA